MAGLLADYGVTAGIAASHGGIWCARRADFAALLRNFG